MSVLVTVSWICIPNNGPRLLVGIVEYNAIVCAQSTKYKYSHRYVHTVCGTALYLTKSFLYGMEFVFAQPFQWEHGP